MPTPTPQTMLDRHLHALMWSIEQEDKKAFIDQIEKIQDHVSRYNLLPTRRRLHQTSGEIMGHAITYRVREKA